MRLLATLTVTLIITAFVAVFVWGWYEGRVIPEMVFGALLTLVASLVGYMWLRTPEREKHKDDECK
jgi:uncharacterized membrane protein